MSKTNEVHERPPESKDMSTALGGVWAKVYQAEQRFGRIMAELMRPTDIPQFVGVAETDKCAAQAYAHVLEMWEEARSRDLWRRVMERVEKEFTADFGNATPPLGFVSPDLLRAIGQLVMKMLAEQEASARDETETPA